MKKKALVLLSAGLDSSVNLFEAHNHFDEVSALTFNYGQKAAAAEIRSAEGLCKILKISHRVLSLPFFVDFNRSSLIQHNQDIPVGESIDIHSLETSAITARSVWVPNRNGILLNIAAGFAEAAEVKYIVPGFNAEEALTFPDNSEAYLKSLDQAFSYSTSNKVEVVCFTSRLNKTEIVKRGIDLKVPFEKIWPCYFSGPSWCGQCESCQRSKSAMRIAGLNTAKMFQA